MDQRVMKAYQTATVLLLGLALVLGWFHSSSQARADEEGSEPQVRRETTQPTITIAHADGDDGLWANEVDGVKRPSPDNTIRFIATISPGTEQRKIRFVLVDTSSEPGVNLNTDIAGQGADQDALDLTFENQNGFDNPTGTKQEIVEDNANNNTATVIVTAHDYGPFANIKAVIDGTSIESEQIKVLNDTSPTGGNNIEDAWDTANPAASGGSLAADDDEDQDPGSYGDEGDTLSRYEEYRGFTINSAFKTTDPAVLDVFYHDKDSIGETGDFTTAKLNNKINVHALGSTDEYETYTSGGKTYTKINPNREFATIGIQGIIRATNDNSIGSNWGLAEFNWTPSDIHRNGVPASNIRTAVWVDRYARSIETSAAIDDSVLFIPAKANTNNGDGSMIWNEPGRIKLDDEEIDYELYNGTPKTVTLAVDAKAAHTVLLIDFTGGVITDANFGQLGDSDELVKWERIRTRGQTTNLDGAINATVTAIPVDFTHFTSAPSAYITVGDEVMKVTSFGPGEVLNVERGALDSTAAANADNAVVKFEHVVESVTRGLGGTTAADHSAGDDLETPRGFLATARTNGANHAANTTVNYFYSEAQRNAAIRMTFAHECSHSLNFQHTNPTRQAITVGTLNPGAYDGEGVYHQFSTFNINNNLTVANE